MAIKLQDIINLVELGNEDEAIKLHQNSKILEYIVPRDLIISEKLAKFFVKIDLKPYVVHKFSDAKAIDIFKKIAPKMSISFSDDQTMQVAYNWCSENKEIFWWHERIRENRLTLNWIDKVFKCPLASFWSGSRYMFEYSSDLAYKLREINKRPRVNQAYPNIWLLVRKEQDYNEILHYTMIESDESKKKSEIYAKVYSTNGFRINSLSMNLPLGNFDDYYNDGNHFSELSESAMLYLLKKNKMTKRWASNLSVDRMKFLQKNGYKDFTQYALREINRFKVPVYIHVIEE